MSWPVITLYALVVFCWIGACFLISRCMPKDH